MARPRKRKDKTPPFGRPVKPRPIESRHRLSSCLLCQRFLSRLRSGLVLSDEAEDLFPTDSPGISGLRMRSAHDKGFTNRLLEENSVPTTWVTNSVGQIDPAVLRRFDFQLEVLFLCSTNLVDQLDQAAFRRFVMKVRFEYLRPDQAWAMFVAPCPAVGCAANETLRPELGRLRLLTPGDFAAVRRQFSPSAEPPTADRIAVLLEEECRMKRDGEGGARGIGFRG